ncbi:MAG TPA: helix-turn-helix domain-containing protein [Candidatus Limnocylindrales bacterium]|nr:helix-turn-helix domain-containing protein [Candidatus Limnocylindrales bacterium]
MSKFVRGSRDWVGLGEASRLLGVAPATLRRWSDDGRISVFTTPGGHRRYRRSTLKRIVAEAPAGRPQLARSGMTAVRLQRAYRRGAREAARSLPWLVALSAEQRDWFRTHGRRLAETLLAHLDAVEPAQGDHQLSEATAEAAGYGRMASGLGLSLGQTVEGFLEFRRPFLTELSLVARRRGFDTTATTDLIGHAERAMDRLLVALMAAHRVEALPSPLAAPLPPIGPDGPIE